MGSSGVPFGVCTIAANHLSLAMIPSGWKMLGCWWISLDDVAHALLADSFAALGRSYFEISSKSPSREFSPASPTPGADPKSQPAPVKLSGSCLLGLAFPLLERMENSASARAARYRHSLAS
jgi:hypothetical protein